VSFCFIGLVLLGGSCCLLCFVLCFVGVVCCGTYFVGCFGDWGYWFLCCWWCGILIYFMVFVVECVCGSWLLVLRGRLLCCWWVVYALLVIRFWLVGCHFLGGRCFLFFVVFFLLCWICFSL